MLECEFSLTSIFPYKGRILYDWLLRKKVSVFEVFIVRIQSKCGEIQTKKPQIHSLFMQCSVIHDFVFIRLYSVFITFWSKKTLTLGYFTRLMFPFISRIPSNVIKNNDINGSKGTKWLKMFTENRNHHPAKYYSHWTYGIIWTYKKCRMAFNLGGSSIE